MNRNFASDNYSGCSPQVLEAVIKANEYNYCYGADDLTKSVEREFKKLFDMDVDSFLVFNGTGANVFGIEILSRPASAVICSNECHLITMEAGAMTKFTGMQPLVVKTTNGKIDINGVRKAVQARGDFHSPQPKIITIAQVAESGAVYTLNELKEISQIAKQNDMYLHIDGARISNALVSMGITPAEFAREVQPDVVVFGGTKNGLMFGEAVLVFNKQLVQDCLYLRKQSLQLMSKMKFLSAQFLPYLQENLWYKNAKHANDMAKYLAGELRAIGVEIVNSVDANIMFINLPKHVIKPLREFSHFYVWDGDDDNTNTCRLITNFDSREGDIDAFVKKLQGLLRKAA